MTTRALREKGEVDYDFVEDILLFKVKNREYDRSIEANNFIVDIDKGNFIVGVQIFDASRFLGLGKVILRNVSKWRFCAHIHENVIEIRLNFQIIYRNRIIQKEPIIVESLGQRNLPASEVVCATG